MKKYSYLLLSVILMIAFSFSSCESEKEDMEAKYTYLSDLIHYYDNIGYSEFPPTCTIVLEDNSLLIKKTDVEFPTDEGRYRDKPMWYRIDTEISNDTIYVTEKWFNSSTANTPRYRNSNVLVSNIPKGKWVINNKLAIYPGENEQDFGEPLPPPYISSTGPYITTKQIFSIEIE